MADDKERILKDILEEIKKIRNDLYNIQRDMRVMKDIEYEVKELKRKL